MSESSTDMFVGRKALGEPKPAVAENSFAFSPGEVL